MEQTAERIDDLIGQVESFYRSITGQDAPPTRGDAPYAPIPPERDPERHLAEQVDRLLASLGHLSPGTPPATGWIPPMSLWETPSEVWICLDLPGVTREAVPGASCMPRPNGSALRRRCPSAPSTANL